MHSTNPRELSLMSVNAVQRPTVLAAAILCVALLPPGSPRRRRRRRRVAPAAPERVTTVEGITEYRLANGLRVLLFPDQTKQTITVNVTYLVGSRHENYGETGMAHLLEHMVFKGIDATIKDIPNELSAHGARPNGTTSWDRTNYFETFSATEENLRWALDLEADRMVNSVHREEGSRQRDDRGAQRIRDGREPARRRAVQARCCPWPTTGTTTATRPSARARTSRACRSSACRRSTGPTTSPTTPSCSWPASSTRLPRCAGQRVLRTAFRVPTRALPELHTVEPAQDGERQVVLRRVGDVQWCGTAYHIPAGPHED